MDDILRHYGTKRHSGRYPWGSGENPYQSSIGFKEHIQQLRRQGYSDVQIAELEGITTTQLRKRLSLAQYAKEQQRAEDRARVLRMKEHGYSNMEIARRMSTSDKIWNESSIRSLLDPVIANRASMTTTTANMLKDQVKEKRYIDIGRGVETQLGITRSRLTTAVALLEELGYKLHTVNVPLPGAPNRFTIYKVLGAPDTTWKELVNDVSLIKSINARSEDYGRSFSSDLGMKPIKNVDSKRVQVRYAEDGGNLKDGVIELRRGVDDLVLGKAQYAQVRIGVDGTHFLKGMAIYNDNMPNGIDIIYNTNKKKGTPLLGSKDNSVAKLMKDDPDNPFGSTLKKEVNEFGEIVSAQRGALNIVNEEGDWEKWSKTISSQILSKQQPALAKQQLGLSLKQRQEEYDEIMSLTNPVIKKQLLMSFADDCDSASVHLKAAALPRQSSKVILPIPSMKETEVYAPTFNNGEVVVLIRHPHGGRFEIPQLIVNNKSKEAKAIMENAIDGIGIHPKVAQKLSGADFDGDTVIVIPNNKNQIKTAASLKSLKDFDPIEAYPGYPGMNKISKANKEIKMGEVSNLITDMTIKGAPPDEIARAVKHSMVIIDAEKHGLDYKTSYKQNGIAALSEKYQKSKRGGASTLISKASSEERVPHRKSSYQIDPNTGAKVYKTTGQTYIDKKTGRIIPRTTASTKMAEAPNAYALSSGRPIEQVYAGYANELKSMANTSRLTAKNIKPSPASPSAKVVYKKEVDSLNAQLTAVLQNKPKERDALVFATSVINRKRLANPDIDKDDLKKLRTQAMAEARVRTGAKRIPIDISDREWEAIQAGAISASKLSMIIQNADLDRVKQLATPRTKTLMTPAKIALAKARLNSGFTLAEVANSLGVSASTLSKAVS